MLTFFQNYLFIFQKFFPGHHQSVRVWSRIFLLVLIWIWNCFQGLSTDKKSCGLRKIRARSHAIVPFFFSDSSDSGNQILENNVYFFSCHTFSAINNSSFKCFWWVTQTPSLIRLHGKIWAWVKVFRIIPEFRILRLTFCGKSASKCWIRKILIASALICFQSV